MGRQQKKVSTEGGLGLSANPFAALSAEGLQSAPAGPSSAASTPQTPVPVRNRGRVDVRREKAGRGGKTVTLAYGFKGISEEEKLTLAKTIQRRCGAGGSLKNGAIEIQGDNRDAVRAALEAAGFQVVFAGG